MKKFGLAALAAPLLAVVLPFAQSVFAESGLTVDALREMRQTQLDATYLAAKPGPLPNGDSAGTAVFFPSSGSLINSSTQRLAALAWQGKVFDTEDGVLTNKVFGFSAIKAKVFYGDSLLDGKSSIIIDYAETSLLFGKIRDEIRLVGDDLYLGRAYYRGFLADYMVVNFILDFSGN